MIAMVIMLSFAPWASAKPAEGTVESPVEVSQTEPVAEDPTVVDPAPESAPTEPIPEATELIPTEPAPLEPPPEPEPTQVPDQGVTQEPIATEPEAPVPQESVAPEPTVTEPVAAPTPTEFVPTETTPPTVEPTATTEPTATIAPTATVVPTPTVAPTPTPIPTPSPTPIPMAISWSQPEPVQCTAISGNAQSLAVGDSATWRCEASIATSSSGELPDDLKITWVLGANYTGDEVSITLVPGSVAELVAPDALTAAHEAQVRVRTPWADGDRQSIAYEVVVTRTTCSVGSADLRLTADPQFENDTSDVQITRTDVATQTLVVATAIAAGNGEPTVRFDGPIMFESLSATSDGFISPISHGTAVIIVEGEWNPCSTWTLSLSGTVDVPADTPAQMSVVSINEQPLSGGACDLEGACDLIVLPPTGSAATPLRYTIGFELQLHVLTPAGSFGIDMRTGLNGVATQP